MKKLRDILPKKKIKWVPIEPKHLKHEHEEIYADLKKIPKHLMPGDVRQELDRLKDFDTFKNALEHASIEKIKPKETKNILNHTYTKDWWSKFPEQKRKEVKKDFNKGKVERTILLRNKKTGQLWQFIHNSHLFYRTTMQGKKAEVAIINYE